jgi:heterodisulfide reductase subunit A-like polyferredoxin
MIIGPDETLRIFCAALQGVIIAGPKQTPDEIAKRTTEIARAAEDAFANIEIS